MRIRFVVCTTLAALAVACEANTDGLVTLSVGDLTEQLAREPATLVCDANTSKTRSRYGVVPGARLLSNYRDYDLEGELGADRGQPMVFYCHSERCGAAAAAARKAIAAGYTRVAILPAGILGWAAAGQPINQPAKG